MYHCQLENKGEVSCLICILIMYKAEWFTLGFVGNFALGHVS